MSIDFEVAIAELLLADAGVSGLVGVGIYANAALQSSPLPRVIITVNSRNNTRTMSGLSGNRKWSLAIACQAKDKTTSESIRLAIANALDEFRGTIGAGAFVVEGAFEQDATDNYIAPQQAEGLGIFEVMADYDIHWHAAS